MIRVLISAMVVVVLFSGCTYFPASGSSTQLAGDREYESVTVPEMEASPTMVVEARSEPPKRVSMDPYPAYAEADKNVGESGQTRGWRVQVFTTENEVAAQEYKNKVEIKLDMDAYIVVMYPYYKVRVGNCLTREEAEELENKVRAKGFETFIVRDTVEMDSD